jgi:hypothetical protein
MAHDLGFFFVVLFLAVLELELRASHLLGRCSTTSAMSRAFFCFSYFSDKLLRFCPGFASQHSPSMSPIYWGLEMNTTPFALLIEMGSH